MVLYLTPISALPMRTYVINMFRLFTKRTGKALPEGYAWEEE